MPYLVDTVVPSTSGSRSRCTPWRDTSAPCVSERLVILSISSRKTMPFCSTLRSALRLEILVVDELRRLLLGQELHRLADLQLAHALAALPEVLEHALDLRGQVLHAGRREDLHLTAASPTISISISLSSSSPSRSFLRNFWRVARIALGARRPSSRAPAAAARRGCGPRRGPRPGGAPCASPARARP